jgi:hypothetical protein
MHSILKAVAFVFLTAAASIPFALCEETIARLPDGRYLVQVKGVTVALPEEDPNNKQIGFSVSTPPGTSPFHFYLTDLVRDPDRYAPRLRSSEWASVSAWPSYGHPREIIGIQVERGVNNVGILSGVDVNFESWRPQWAHDREIAADVPADQYGWIRREPKTRIDQTIFVKFLDEGDRLRSRYYALSCEIFGSCSLRARHGNFTARISFYSANKPRGEDYAVKDFDQQIASGIKVLEHMLVNESVDLSLP